MLASCSRTTRAIVGAALLLLAACGGPGRPSESAPPGAGEPVPKRDRFADLRAAGRVPRGIGAAVGPTQRRPEPAAPEPAAPVTANPVTAAPVAEAGAASGRDAEPVPASARTSATAASQRPDPRTPPGGTTRHAGAVARLEVEVPVDRQVLVRATLPVPDTFTWSAARARRGTTPFALEDPSGALVPCQVEVVTRGPSGAVEVVELIAPVTAPRALTRAGGAAEGHARLALGVHLGEFTLPADAPLDPRVADWLAAGPCSLRARDVHGNLYVGDLLRPHHGAASARGPYLRRIDAAAVMRPVDEPERPADAATALPHLFGVHAHIAVVAGDPRVALDLRVHAGLTSGAAEDTQLDTPVGALWFDQLQLELPVTWTVDAQFPDAVLGDEVRHGKRTLRSIVREQERRHVHFMPPAGQLERRLVLRPRDSFDGHPTWEGLGFPLDGDGLWSWHARPTARYFPQRVALPTAAAYDGPAGIGAAALRARLAERRDALMELIRRGSGDGVALDSPALGWAHPAYPPTAGDAGRAGLALVEGHLAVAARSVAELERIALHHQANVSRHAVAAWLPDGRPAGLDAWSEGTPEADAMVPFDPSAEPGGLPPELRLAALGGAAPAAHLEAVIALSRRPEYDLGAPFVRGGALPTQNHALLAFGPHSRDRTLRVTKDAKALAWLANDRLARADLLLEAERFRLGFAGSRRGASEGSELARLAQLAARRPRGGLPVGRAHAFGFDAVAGAYALADDAWRARFAPFVRAFVDVRVAATLPNGHVVREHDPGLLRGRVDGANTADVLLLLHAERALVESVLRGVDPARTEALEAAACAALDYLYAGPPYQAVPDRWSKDSVVSGPAAQFAVAPRAVDGGESAEPPYCVVARWGPDYLPPDGRATDAVELTYSFDVLTYAADRAEAGSGPGSADATRWWRYALSLGQGAADATAVAARLALEDGAADLTPTGYHAAFLASLQHRRGRP